MRLLFYNDSHLFNDSSHDISKSLQRCLISFAKLKNDFPKGIDGIITAKTPSETYLSIRNETLLDIVNMLDRESKTLAFALFTKYPLYKQITILEETEDKAVLDDFKINISGIDKDATNLYLVSQFGCISMSLDLVEEFRFDKLVLTSGLNGNIEVHNLFGEDNNNLAIAGLIRDEMVAQMENEERFRFELNNPNCTDKAIKNFNSYPKDIQDVIINEIVRAKKRNLDSDFQPDGDLIKDVTHESIQGERVYELRIFNPKAIRLYFAEIEGAVYVSNVLDKPKKKKQNLHIRTAHTDLITLINSG